MHAHVGVERVGVSGPVRGEAERGHGRMCEGVEHVLVKHVHREESVSAKSGILSRTQDEPSERKFHSRWGAMVRGRGCGWNGGRDPIRELSVSHLQGR